MIRKVQLRLTLLSGGITTLILIIMTLGFLYISEKNILENKNYSCQSDMYSIAATLEQQSIISHTWLSQLEANGNYYVSAADNGISFLFNSRSENTIRNEIISEAWEHYKNNDTAQNRRTISYKSSYTSFMLSLKSDQGITSQKYYCFVITVAEKQSTLEMLLIAPLTGMQQQILRQRLLFLGIISLALIAIWIFAWIFTGKLLQPIEENRIKQNQFIAAASHELRTPLAVILSCSEAACERFISQNETFATDNSIITALHQDLLTIKSEALRTSRLLGDMLTLSSHDSGHFDINCCETELDTLLLNVYEKFENMAKQKHIIFTAKLPMEALPACLCDNERITQVITILVHNAISYTPSNGHVLISIIFRKKYFEIKISDTGIGINDDEKSKIFDRFYRSEQARSDKNHFGLGLSIAREIITAHHGKITVNDTPGGGSTFTILLPEKNLSDGS